MKSIARCIWLAVMLLALGTTLGCDSGKLKTYPVKGKVVFANGSPVKVGTVETKSVDHGVQATGNIDLDGSFTLTTYRANDGAVAGQHRCVVIQFVPVEEIPNYRPSTLGVVNRKHSTYSTSELSITVNPDGPNEVQLVVQGADPILKSTEDHGHDPIPEDPEGKKGQ